MTASRSASGRRRDPQRPDPGRVPGLPGAEPAGREKRGLRIFRDTGVAGRIMVANGVMLVGIALLVTTILYFVLSDQHDRRAERQLTSTAESLARSTLVLDHIVDVQSQRGDADADADPLPVFLADTDENALLTERLEDVRTDYGVDLVEVIPASQLSAVGALGGTSSSDEATQRERPIIVASGEDVETRTGSIVTGLDQGSLANGETTVRYIGGGSGMLVAVAPILTGPPPGAGAEATPASGADTAEQGDSSRTARGQADLGGDAIAAPQVVGAAVVGMSPDAVRDAFAPQARAIWFMGGLVILLGVGANWVTLRGLRRVTGDYGTEELGAVLDYYGSVLRAVSEGLVLADRGQGIVFYNEEAAQLLGMPDSTARTPIALQDLDLDPSLKALLAEGRYARDEIHYTVRRVLVVNQQPASQSPDTWVMTMRDHTELQELTGELVSVRSFSESLRSQTHEYANRLHMIVSLVETGAFDEAVQFATREIDQAERPADNLLDGFDHPILTALLLTKMSQASENGIRLELDTDDLHGTITADDRDLVTIIGNLVDNALDAVSSDAVPADRRTVRVRFSGNKTSGLVIEVSDDGPGIAESALDNVFERGWSTKHDGVAQATGEGRMQHASRGVGLALTVQAVRRMGGAIDVQGSGDELCDEAEVAEMPKPLRGALFTVWVPAAPEADTGATGAGDLR
ncbi:sensor histidine kinase [Brevibacterium senegalense]|uniref:sensor histidine kinase n=1 Tax=Brevibacterium senegalense TaxID=1033736 RepID=UPI00036D27EC|nr:ATP-binding protein [Brevibacterium senegalense]